MTRPNVLLLYTDQQRWDTIAAGGNSIIATPNLDRIASRGALFQSVFANCPVCMPSRMSMLSGQYPATLGVRCNGIEMPEMVPCVHNLLSSYGYHTANIGKLHFHNHASPYRDHREPHPRYGFDTLILSDEPGCYDDAYLKWVEERAPGQVSACRINTPPAWTGKPVTVHPRNTHQPYVFDGREDLTHSAFVADEVCRYLETRGPNPFFCVAGFYAPHAPLNPPKRFVDMYDPEDMPLPYRQEGENFQDVTDEQWRRIKAFYYALITHVDDQIGRILDTLSRQGLEDDTIVIFTADHGENLGDHGLVQKSQPLDSSARVPLLVSYPEKVTAGAVIEDIVEAVDITPTILDFCGVQIPPIMQGQSLRPVLDSTRSADRDGAMGSTYSPRRSAFIERLVPFESGYKAVRSSEYLYSRDRAGREELYDLRTDPHQLVNRVGDREAASLLAEARHELMSRWFDVDSQYPKRTGQY